ncbi:conserved Plasmodium protein, unknown function [Plasmodium sp. gorilla clade G3]|nr:conserved Plasmodium protein, unknown function [Plasmodium sp. gorilla clade G3]
MFNYFLRSIKNCKSKDDVTHLCRKFLKNINYFNTYEISLCINKFSKIAFEDKLFWKHFCLLITTRDENLVKKFLLTKKNDINNNKCDNKEYGKCDDYDDHKVMKVQNKLLNLEEHKRDERNNIIYFKNGTCKKKDDFTEYKLFHEEDKKEENQKKKDKLLHLFNIEELCLILNSLSKVNIKNDDILKYASHKLINHINLNKYLINTIKALTSLSGRTQGGKNKSVEINNCNNTNGCNDNMYESINVQHILQDKIYQNINNLHNILTEKDISILIELMITHNDIDNKNKEDKLLGDKNIVIKNTKKDSKTIKEKINTYNDNNEIHNNIYNNNNVNVNFLKKKLFDSLKKVNHISEQSISLILQACSKSSEKNKQLLDILKVIIILKLKKEKKCSDIFLSSVIHSYASVNYKDKILFNILSNYIYTNINYINIKALIIILNSYVNIEILNIKLFSIALNKLAKKDVLLNLSNQCTSNIITIFTKTYHYLDKEKIKFIFNTIIQRIKHEYNEYNNKYDKNHTHLKENISYNKSVSIRTTPLLNKKNKIIIINNNNNNNKNNKNNKNNNFPESIISHKHSPYLKYIPRNINITSKKKDIYKNQIHQQDSNQILNQNKFFILNFLTKHITNILNNLSKLNMADTKLYEIFSSLILKKKKNDINKLDLLNITSSYSRAAYRNEHIYNLIIEYSKQYILSNELKYVEFINLFTSISTFYILEKNEPSNTYKRKFNEIIKCMIQRLKGEEEKIINKNYRKDIDRKMYDKIDVKKIHTIHIHNSNEIYKNILNVYEERHEKQISHCSNYSNEELHSDKNINGDENKNMVTHINNNLDEESVDKNHKDLHVNEYCYNYDNIRNKNILDNLNINHLAYILSTLCKLNIHDEYIYNKCVINIRKKIFKMNCKCLSIYLLYISKFNIIQDTYIKNVIASCYKLKYEKKKKKKITNLNMNNNIFLKMNNLYKQLLSNDIINSIYIIRCLIKNDIDMIKKNLNIYNLNNNINDGMYSNNSYNNIYVIYFNLLYIYNLYSSKNYDILLINISRDKNVNMFNNNNNNNNKTVLPFNSEREREKKNNTSCSMDKREHYKIKKKLRSYISDDHNNDDNNNIIKMDDMFFEEQDNIIKTRELNIHSSCILLNSLSYLLTHVYFYNEKYYKIIYYLLLCNFKYVFQKLKLKYTIYDLLYNLTDLNNETETKNIVQDIIDSASLRQLYMSILMLYYLHPLHIPINTTINNILNKYPLFLLQYIYFFLKYSPIVSFEKYRSIYNSFNNIKFIYYNDDYSHNNKKKINDQNVCHHKHDDNKTPNISTSELNVYNIILNILRKNNKLQHFHVSTTFNIYMYSVDILITSKKKKKKK